MRPFIAFICKRPDGGFAASFPDLPDCGSSGATVAEALLNAESALADYCRALRDAAAPIPPPSLVHELADTPDGLLVLIPPPPDLWEPEGFMRSG